MQVSVFILLMSFCLGMVALCGGFANMGVMKNTYWWSVDYIDQYGQNRGIIVYANYWGTCMNLAKICDDDCDTSALYSFYPQCQAFDDNNVFVAAFMQGSEDGFDEKIYVRMNVSVVLALLTTSAYLLCATLGLVVTVKDLDVDIRKMEGAALVFGALATFCNAFSFGQANRNFKPKDTYPEADWGPGYVSMVLSWILVFIAFSCSLRNYVVHKQNARPPPVLTATTVPPLAGSPPGLGPHPNVPPPDSPPPAGPPPAWLSQPAQVPTESDGPPSTQAEQSQPARKSDMVSINVDAGGETSSSGSRPTSEKSRALRAAEKIKAEKAAPPKG